MLILIKGAGDLASGVACKLHECGAQIIMTETERPTTVRCTVAFSPAVYDGTATVEGITAKRAVSMAEALAIASDDMIAVIVDPTASIARELPFDAVVDAIMAKSNLGTRITDAPIVVALGPGFCAGKDCHAVIETERGHNLGRVIYDGEAAPNTGIPGSVNGATTERIIRACRDGVFSPVAQIGQTVSGGQTIANIYGDAVRAPISGMVRGLLPYGTPVREGMKAGDIDPRGVIEYCYTLSDKARAVAGGVLEALLHCRSVI